MSKIIRLEETQSTNSLLRELLCSEVLPEESVVVADYQTAGRGQVGNTWESRKGENLLFSLVLYPTFLPINRQFRISQVAALSVKDTLDEYVSDITVKWPNDIYWQNKKICGMLIENDLSGRELSQTIIGIGLNINQQEFVSNAPNPISLAQITGHSFDREEILNKFLTHLSRRYHTLQEGAETAIHAEYMAALFRSNGFYPYRDANGTFEARIHSIEPTGHLILQLNNNELRRYAFKEVAIV